LKKKKSNIAEEHLMATSIQHKKTRDVAGEKKRMTWRDKLSSTWFTPQTWEWSPMTFVTTTLTNKPVGYEYEAQFSTL